MYLVVMPIADGSRDTLTRGTVRCTRCVTLYRVPIPALRCLSFPFSCVGTVFLYPVKSPLENKTGR